MPRLIKFLHEEDVVLKSGGPPMKIGDIDVYRTAIIYTCRWIDKDGMFHEELFSEDELQKSNSGAIK